MIALKITNSLRCLLPRAADPVNPLCLCCLPVLTLQQAEKPGWVMVCFRYTSPAHRLQKMTASRCMSRQVCLFGVCATADGEINAGWTSDGRFVWFPQCHVYISLGFLFQSWPSRDPQSSVHLDWAVTCPPFFSCWGGHNSATEGAAFAASPYFIHASCPPRFSPCRVVWSVGVGVGYMI